MNEVEMDIQVGLLEERQAMLEHEMRTLNEQAEAAEQTVAIMKAVLGSRLKELESAVKSLDSITDSHRRAIAEIILRQEPIKHNDVETTP